MGRIPLKFTIWTYFMVFTILVFLLMWLLSPLFLEAFYRNMTIRDVGETAAQITKSFETDDTETFVANINKISFQDNVCIEVLDRYGRPYTGSHRLGDCLIHNREYSNYKYLTRINESADGKVMLIDENPRGKYNMFIYGGLLGDIEHPTGYLLINAALVPIGSTVAIIKRQLLIITAILILFALLYCMM